ncbi:MAG: hypothetical protein ACJ707_01410, partial [Nitrososphaera sp.]
SIVEEKVKDAATEVRTSVGYELGQASKTVKGKMRDAGEAVVNVDVEGATSRIKDLAQAGADTAKEKIGAAQSSTEAGLRSENMMRFERESKQSSTDADLGSYEGKYPKDLFNKTLIVNEQAMGRIVKETYDQVVVFSDSGNLRFDIPKSKIALSGGSIVLGEPLEQYAVDKDAPMPEDRALRASVQEIRQKAGDIPEGPTLPVEEKDGPTLPVEERKPSIVEEKVKDAATEVRTSVGYELGQASKTVKGKMRDAGEAVVNVDVEGAARQAASRIKDLAQAGAETARGKITTAQSSRDAGLSVESSLKIEKELKQPSTEPDLAAYEGKYPSDLFNKTVTLNDQPIGRVVKETDEVIVVFSDADSSIRFDIPKSEIAVAGGSVIANEDLLFRYRTHRDAPMPEDRALRASAQEIRAAATEQIEIEKKDTTTADSIMEEGKQLATVPRPETTSVSKPETYIDTESEISKKMKGALAELREIILAGTKAAKKKAKQVQETAAERRAEMDAEAISRMGDLAMRFADSFEDILEEIRTRTYAEQVQIYTGFIRLIDQQRTLVLARRDFAERLKDSVNTPMVEPRDIKTSVLGSPPELPEELEGNKTLSESRSTTTTSSSRRRRRVRSSKTAKRKA